MGDNIKHLMVALLAMTFVVQAHAKINRIYQPILVSQTTTLSPHRLCHDGLFVYFKDKKHCQSSNIPGFDCDKNYYIAPIRSSEQIYLPHNSDKYITRFYHIELEYHYQEVDSETNNVYVSEPRTVSACDDRKMLVTENVTYRRATRTAGEYDLVASLIDQAARSEDESFLILNTPIGNVNEAETLSLEDAGKSEFELNQAKVKTPFCSDFDPDEIWLMSGEYTGSGVRSLVPASLQRISRPLYVKKSHFVVNPDTGKLEKRYEFTCERIWSI